jgi:hypothetical protein
VHMLRVRNQAKQAAQSGPPLALAFPRSSHSATADSEQENNQETSDKLQVSQANPTVIGLTTRTKGETGKNVTDHMRDKCAKTDIKLKHNFTNINANRARHNEHMAPLEPALRVRQ